MLACLKRHPWTNGWEIVFRILFISAHLLILSALGKQLFEIEGFGAWSIKEVNEWGGIFLKYATITTIIAAVLFPIRLSFYFSGLIMGGLTMIGLKEGRDIRDLAEMEGNIPDLEKLVKILPAGDQLILGLKFSVALVITATLVQAARILLSVFSKKAS
ncbi:hypothetical protein OAF99_00600 [Akkermansiaceae bacterium]|nr:hypothetical protein [Akkermansiaceae bacterium]MDB4758819.1 hypothetical protein [Akkermansiaceae bacterium]